jgi:hypothetical protein
MRPCSRAGPKMDQRRSEHPKSRAASREIGSIDPAPGPHEEYRLTWLLCQKHRLRGGKDATL